MLQMLYIAKPGAAVEKLWTLKFTKKNILEWKKPSLDSTDMFLLLQALMTTIIKSSSLSFRRPKLQTWKRQD